MAATRAFSLGPDIHLQSIIEKDSDESMSAKVSESVIVHEESNYEEIKVEEYVSEARSDSMKTEKFGEDEE